MSIFTAVVQGWRSCDKILCTSLYCTDEPVVKMVRFSSAEVKMATSASSAGELHIGVIGGRVGRVS